VVADQGYHSNEVLVDLHQEGVRSYIPEPERGPRNWDDKKQEQKRVYGNRRRMRGRRGKDLQKLRTELTERTFAHMYETGGMRRTHLRKRGNILKRLLFTRSDSTWRCWCGNVRDRQTEDLQDSSAAISLVQTFWKSIRPAWAKCTALGGPHFGFLTGVRQFSDRLSCPTNETSTTGC